VPPPGVIPNFVDPETRGPVLLIVGSIFMVIMLVLASMRFYTKIFIVRRLTWDDYTCGIAVVGTIMYFIASCYAVTAGRYGTHFWDISLAQLFGNPMQISGFIINFLTAVVWPFAKMSFFLLYLQLFSPILWLRYMIYFGAAVNILFYTSIVAATIYFTAPAPHESWVEAYVSPRYAGALKMTIPIASGSLVLDIYIFLLPIFGLYGLQMSPKKKFGIMIVFATGLSACLASSLSIYYKSVLDADIADYTYRVLPPVLMALVEMCVGISASCMPALARMVRNGDEWAGFRSKFSSIFGSLMSWRTSNSQSKTPRSGDLSTDLGITGLYSTLNESQSIPMNGVSTSIRHGRPSAEGSVDGDIEQGGIHLKYGFRQVVADHSSINTGDGISKL